MNQNNSVNIETIFKNCLSGIGGNKNPDVIHYSESRKQDITRANFFEKVVWAVWVAGMGRKATSTFFNESNIPRDYKIYAAWNRDELDDFMRRVHYHGVNPRAESKWLAIYKIAQWLVKFPSEENFRQTLFDGKVKGELLNKSDVQKILALRLPFIGWANSHYLVKNMGGQAIKCDRWVKKLLIWGKLSQTELENRLEKHNIPFSLFDTVFWSYCEMFIGKTGDFDRHFNSKFGFLKL